MFSYDARVHSGRFEEALKKGKMRHSSLFSLCYLKDDHKAFAAVASKKVSKRAVIRNRNKRRVRHALKKLEGTLPAGAYIVFIKKDLAAVPYPEVSKDLSNLLVI